jgi:hypothetical protein
VKLIFLTPLYSTAVALHCGTSVVKQTINKDSNLSKLGIALNAKRPLRGIAFSFGGELGKLLNYSLLLDVKDIQKEQL